MKWTDRNLQLNKNNINSFLMEFKNCIIETYKGKVPSQISKQVLNSLLLLGPYGAKSINIIGLYNNETSFDIVIVIDLSMIYVEDWYISSKTFEEELRKRRNVWQIEKYISSCWTIFNLFKDSTKCITITIEDLQGANYARAI